MLRDQKWQKYNWSKSGKQKTKKTTNRVQKPESQQKDSELDQKS